eukprot:62196-Amphidinium_carterae.1
MGRRNDLQHKTTLLSRSSPLFVIIIINSVLVIWCWLQQRRFREASYTLQQSLFYSAKLSWPLWWACAARVAIPREHPLAMLLRHMLPSLTWRHLLGHAVVST